MTTAQVTTQRLLPAREVPVRSSVSAERRHRLRKRGVGELLDLAVEVFLGRFGTFVASTVFFLLPFHLGGELFLYIAPTAGDDLLVEAGFGVIGFFLLSWGLARVFIVSLVGDELMGRELSVSSALRASLGRLPGLVLLVAFVWAAAAVGTCACILPIFLAVWLFEPSVSAFALDRRRGALGIASALHAVRSGPVLASGWPSFLRWLGCTFASFAFAFPFLGRFYDDLGFRDVVQAHLSPLGAAFVLALTAAFLQAIGLSFRSVVATVFYFDLRVRKHGLDVQASLDQRIRARSSQGSGVAQ